MWSSALSPSQCRYCEGTLNSSGLIVICVSQNVGQPNAGLWGGLLAGLLAGLQIKNKSQRLNYHHHQEQ